MLFFSAFCSALLFQRCRADRFRRVPAVDTEQVKRIFSEKHSSIPHDCISFILIYTGKHKNAFPLWYN